MNYYETLEVNRDASFAEIKAHYRLLSKQHHPDVGGDPAQMARLNRAYMVLSNPLKRASYNATLRSYKATDFPPPGRPQTTRQSASAAPSIHQKARSFRGLWWTLAVGLPSTCLVLISLLVMQNVSATTPTSTSEPTHISKGKLTLHPPQDEPITSSPTPTQYPTDTPAQRPSPPNTATDAVIHQASPPSNNEDVCTRFGLVAHRQCKKTDDISKCQPRTDKKIDRHELACYYR